MMEIMVVEGEIEGVCDCGSGWFGGISAMVWCVDGRVRRLLGSCYSG